jgi:hypothetical protein
MLTKILGLLLMTPLLAALLSIADWKSKRAMGLYPGDKEFYYSCFINSLVVILLESFLIGLYLLFK